MQSTPIKHIRLLCPTLTHNGGHELIYTRGLRDALLATGLTCDVWHPAAAGDLFGPAGHMFDLPAERGIAGSLRARVRLRLSARARAKALQSVIQNDTPDTLTMIHTAGFGDLQIAAGAAGAASGKLCLLLRYDHYDDAGAIAALKAIVAEPTVSVMTDSEDLATEFERLTSRRFSVAPPPVQTSQRGAAPLMAGGVFGYFGGARISKGFGKLPIIVNALEETLPKSAFIIQAYRHPDDTDTESIARASNTLKTYASVQMIEAVQSPSAYRDLQDNCDVFLLPYDAATYARVTSGIFVEALVANRATLIPEDSWMAAEAKRHSLSRAIVTDFNDPSSISTSALQALASLSTPCPATTEWAEKHTFAELAARILATS